jgi:hypothetical protein
VIVVEVNKNSHVCTKSVATHLAAANYKHLLRSFNALNIAACFHDLRTKVGKWGRVHLSFTREYLSISESAAAYLRARIILKRDCAKCFTFPWP